MASPVSVIQRPSNLPTGHCLMAMSKAEKAKDRHAAKASEVPASSGPRVKGAAVPGRKEKHATSNKASSTLTPSESGQGEDKNSTTKKRREKSRTRKEKNTSPTNVAQTKSKGDPIQKKDSERSANNKEDRQRPKRRPSLPTGMENQEKLFMKWNGAALANRSKRNLLERRLSDTDAPHENTENRPRDGVPVGRPSRRRASLSHVPAQGLYSSGEATASHTAKPSTMLETLELLGQSENPKGDVNIGGQSENPKGNVNRGGEYDNRQENIPRAQQQRRPTTMLETLAQMGQSGVVRGDFASNADSDSRDSEIPSSVINALDALDSEGRNAVAAAIHEAAQKRPSLIEAFESMGASQLAAAFAAGREAGRAEALAKQVSNNSRNTHHNDHNNGHKSRPKSGQNSREKNKNNNLETNHQKAQEVDRRGLADAINTLGKSGYLAAAYAAGPDDMDQKSVMFARTFSDSDFEYDDMMRTLGGEGKHRITLAQVMDILGVGKKDKPVPTEIFVDEDASSGKKKKMNLPSPEQIFDKLTSFTSGSEHKEKRRNSLTHNSTSSQGDSKEQQNVQEPRPETPPSSIGHWIQRPKTPPAGSNPRKPQSKASLSSDKLSNHGMQSAGNRLQRPKTPPASAGNWLQRPKTPPASNGHKKPQSKVSLSTEANGQASVHSKGSTGNMSSLLMAALSPMRRQRSFEKSAETLPAASPKPRQRRRASLTHVPTSGASVMSGVSDAGSSIGRKMRSQRRPSLTSVSPYLELGDEKVDDPADHFMGGNASRVRKAMTTPSAKEQLEKVKILVHSVTDSMSPRKKPDGPPLLAATDG